MTVPARRQTIDELPFADNFGELEQCLLVQAFSGRPLKVVKNWLPTGKPWVLLLQMENSELHVEAEIGQEEVEWMCRDHAGFTKEFVEPMCRSLEEAAYPDRMKRLIKAAKRSAELLPMPAHKSANRVLHS